MTDIKVGDYVYTPRFCTVQISKVFESEKEARSCGYREPTYYKGNHVILGKVLDLNCMEFAAIPKGGAYADT